MLRLSPSLILMTISQNQEVDLQHTSRVYEEDGINSSGSIGFAI